MQRRKVPIIEGSRQQVVHSLRALVGRNSTSRDGISRDGISRDGDPASSGCAALDRLLPARGFRRGTLVEWLAAPASGGGTLSLIAAREAALDGGAVVVLDPWSRFYPPAAAALGIDLENLIVIQATSRRETIWALDQVLRCPAVAAAWAPFEQLDARSFRRLQLAAEQGGSIGLLLRPPRARGQPSWADLQLAVHPHPLDGQPSGDSQRSVPTRAVMSAPKTAMTSLPKKATGIRRLQVELICRRAIAQRQFVELEMDEFTGVLRQADHACKTHTLHLAAQLARPATPRHSARA